jgi:hypothetical protein
MPRPTTQKAVNFENELSGAFELLSVENGSKVRTSDLGKLLLSIGASELVELSKYEKIVDAKQSGLFSLEKVILRVILYIYFFFFCDIQRVCDYLNASKGLTSKNFSRTQTLKIF